MTKVLSLKTEKLLNVQMVKKNVQMGQILVQTIKYRRKMLKPGKMQIVH